MFGQSELTALAEMLFPAVPVGRAPADSPWSQIGDLIFRQSLAAHSINCPCLAGTGRGPLR